MSFLLIFYSVSCESDTVVKAVHRWQHISLTTMFSFDALSIKFHRKHCYSNSLMLEKFHYHNFSSEKSFKNFFNCKTI